MCELVFDVETTTFAKGNPFSERNRLCYVGLLGKNFRECIDVEYSNHPYVDSLHAIQDAINNASVLVGFNAKFDLHWLRRYGIDFSHCRIWDCQLVHFILSNQTCTYPSLNEVAAHYGLGTKLDVVNEEYWSQGIDTPDVPEEVLVEYLEQDLDLTYQVYLKQKQEVELLSSSTRKLISLHNQDLLVLQEMEYNGLIFDEERCASLGQQLSEDIHRIDGELASYVSLDGFNFNSGDHLSALLYGGTIVLQRRRVTGMFLSGWRKGFPKEQWQDIEFSFPQLVVPLKNSALKKEGLYSTDEQTLKSLKANKSAKKLIGLLLERSLLEKRRGTYYEGLPKLRRELDWIEGTLHGQLNQCVARTGRLSSSRPNLQNFDGEIKELFGSRY